LVLGSRTVFEYTKNSLTRKTLVKNTRQQRGR
jgi:hypothetical protein